MAADREYWEKTIAWERAEAKFELAKEEMSRMERMVAQLEIEMMEARKAVTLFRREE